MNGRAVVIGGGVIGAACAHYLNRSNWQVTVVERKLSAAALPCKLRFDFSEPHLAIAGPWSHGQNVEGDVQPELAFLDSPASRSFALELDGPVRPPLQHEGFDCRRKDAAKHAKFVQNALWRTFANEPLDAEWQTEGVLFPFLDDSGMDHFAENDRLLREHFGHGADRYDGHEVVKLEPALKDGLAAVGIFPPMRICGRIS